MGEKTRSKLFWTVYVLTVLAAFALVMGICAMVPDKAHAADTSTELVAASVDKDTTQVLTTQSTKKTTNPYKDVISGKTVDKTGYNAVKWVKAHKGYKNVVTGNRFYPNKKLTRAQYTKILRNLYGNKVVLSKSKATVTAKYACSQLTNVAKNVFGVKIKWKAGNGNTKLTRTGASNYVRTFAKWSGGIFAPKQ